ncbi:MAG: sigma-70 family RNA polymerase sigma factor [Odoribacteraceae bacterium]|jgi:RNA polymerase sigma-70 factor (ECF subfamily)|nr:sigma-70 family RNA polymerase sigma factor [Odoribacteraceae bacterium]
METRDEDRIIQLLNAGDERGLKELFDLYYKPLRVYAMHFLDSFEESEDVAQEVLGRFWERARREPFRGSLRAYLFASARNNSTRRLRERARFPLERIDALEDTLACTEEQVGREREDLARALERLPGRGRDVFSLIVLEEMKYKEVAERLGISVNTVKTHFARALKQLRDSLGIVLLVISRAGPRLPGLFPRKNF